MKLALTVFAFLVLMIFAVVFGPILIIFAVNTLFNTQIPFTLETWASVVLLHAFFHTTISVKK